MVHYCNISVSVIKNMQLCHNQSRNVKIFQPTLGNMRGLMFKSVETTRLIYSRYCKTVYLTLDKSIQLLNIYLIHPVCS